MQSPCGPPPVRHLPEFRLLGWPGLSLSLPRGLRSHLRGPRRRGQPRALSSWGPLPPLSPSPRLETAGFLQQRRPAPRQGLGPALWRPGCRGSWGFPGAWPPGTGGSPAPPLAAPASKELREDLLISPRRDRCSCQGGDRCLPGPTRPYRPGDSTGRPGSGLMLGGQAQAVGAAGCAPTHAARTGAHLCARASGATPWPLLGVGVPTGLSRLSPPTLGVTPSFSLPLLIFPFPGPAFGLFGGPFRLLPRV